LIVVGTGIQWAGQTTQDARRAIEQADRVLFAVADPWAARWILDLAPGAEALPYATGETPRRQIYREMVERILRPLRDGRKVTAIFYGHPGVFATPAHEAIRRARAEGLSARMLPGVSALDCLFADLALDPGKDGCHTFEATDFLIRRRAFDVHVPLVLWQVAMIGNLGFLDVRAPRVGRGLAVLAEALCARYPARHEAVIYEAAVHPLLGPRVERVALEDLGGAKVTDVTTLYVPPVAAAPVDREMMARLGMVPEGDSRGAKDAAKDAASSL
jgi:uncharacterized protein YabN with tetrapyrrole methylase and pyrophosphatase domain